jgi:hypothetical protein
MGDQLAGQRQRGVAITPGESRDWLIDARGERGTTTICQLRALCQSDSNLWTNYWHPANSA